MARPPKDRYGSPTGRPESQGIDPWSGFKLPLSDFVQQWDGQMVARENCDIRNPQDYVRGVKENMTLPFARPESPDTFAAAPIVWENEAVMTTQLGDAIFTEGVDASDTL